MYGMIRPPQVSNSPSVVSILNSGVTRAICGNIEMSSARATMIFLPGNSSRAIAYAAIVPKMMAMNVAMMQMPIEFSRARRKSGLLKIAV